MTDTGHEATANAIVEQIKKRREHTREVTREELPEQVKDAIVLMAQKIERLEHTVIDLAVRALRDR